MEETVILKETNKLKGTEQRGILYIKDFRPGKDRTNENTGGMDPYSDVVLSVGLDKQLTYLLTVGSQSQNWSRDVTSIVGYTCESY